MWAARRAHHTQRRPQAHHLHHERDRGSQFDRAPRRAHPRPFPERRGCGKAHLSRAAPLDERLEDAGARVVCSESAVRRLVRRQNEGRLTRCLTGPPHKIPDSPSVCAAHPHGHQKRPERFSMSSSIAKSELGQTTPFAAACFASSRMWRALIGPLEPSSKYTPAIASSFSRTSRWSFERLRQ